MIERIEDGGLAELCTVLSPWTCLLAAAASGHAVVNCVGRCGITCERSTCSASRLSTWVQGWGGGRAKFQRVGSAPPQNFLFFFISKWHILLNSEVINLKYVIILGIFSLTSHPTKILVGMCPRHRRRDWCQWVRDVWDQTRVSSYHRFVFIRAALHLTLAYPAIARPGWISQLKSGRSQMWDCGGTCFAITDRTVHLMKLMV